MMAMRAGFTLLEVTIAAGLALVLLVSTMQFVSDSSDAAASVSTGAELDGALRRILMDLAGEVRQARLAAPLDADYTVGGGLDLTTGQLSFQRVLDISQDAIVYDDVETFSAADLPVAYTVPSDFAGDLSGTGFALVDPPGFFAARQDDVLLIGLTLETTDHDDRTVSRSGTVKVFLRHALNR